MCANLILHFRAKEKAYFSNRASTSAKTSIIKENLFTRALKVGQSLGVVVTDALLQERSWGKSVQALVANGLLPQVVTGELGSSKFRFQMNF